MQLAQVLEQVGKDLGVESRTLFPLQRLGEPFFFPRN